MLQKRKPIKFSDKKFIFEKTGGHCHFCGKKLFFEAKRGNDGRWHIDHIVPFSRKGKNNIINYLPICNVCNRLRWNFKSEKIRDIFRFGVIAYREMRRNTEIGNRIKDIYKKQMEQNKKLRRGDLPESYYR